MPADAARPGAALYRRVFGELGAAEVRPPMAATKLALDRANPGDLVVLCADQVDEIVDELQARVRPAPPAGGRA